MSACTSAPKAPGLEPASATPEVKVQTLGTDSDPVVLLGQDLKVKQSDLPIQINSQVVKWAEYFTGRGRKHFEVYLARADYFIPYIRPILKKEGMPEDLVYLAMIESGFSNHAYSRARAVGPWQFMAPTGKRYGLKINWWVDERRNIEKSTLAAVRYLRDLYQMFGRWELAAAGYNAGEAKVAKALRRYRTRDFWVIARQRFLKAETRNYVPKMFAAALLAKNRTQFGFAAEGAIPITEVASDAKFDRSQYVEMMKEFVAHYGGVDQKPAVIVESLKVNIRKPSGDTKAALLDSIAKASEVDVKAEVAEAAAAAEAGGRDSDDDQGDPRDEDDIAAAAAADEADPAEEDETLDLAEILNTPFPHVSRKGEVGGEKVTEFELKGPADLLKVAQAADIPYELVKGFNPELLRWCTPPNEKTYYIKLPERVKERFMMTYNDPKFEREIKFRAHKVKSGDSLRKVAGHYGVSQEGLLELNGLSKKDAFVRVGSMLYLPIPDDPSRSMSSLDLRDPARPGRSRSRSKRRSQAQSVSWEVRQAAKESRTIRQ